MNEEKIIERLTIRMEKVNQYILSEIARSLEEIGTINPTKLNQLIMGLKYGSKYKSMVKEISKYTKLNAKEIEEIFEMVAKKDYENAKRFYEYRDVKYLPYKQNKALTEEIQALAKITANEITNFSNTTSIGFGIPNKDGTIVFKGLKETYHDAIDEAVLSIQQGKEVFNNAMYRQLHDIAESGLKVIYPTTYIGKDGKEHHYVRRLDSAMRMNLTGALRNLHNETQKIIGEQIGADGVEISTHENPAPDHEDAQGKQFSNEEFEKLQDIGVAKTYDGKRVSLHRDHGEFRPISEWNCYHYTFSIVLGVNKPLKTNEELEAIKQRNEDGFELEDKHYTMYEGEQLQRKIETEIRKQKEIQETLEQGGIGDMFNKSKLRALNRKYKELNQISGLRPRLDRLKI